MKPRSKCALLAVLLATTAGAEERQPSLAHDWTQMTENEKFCVVPSNQQKRQCAWVGPTLYEVANAYRARRYDKALAQFESAARDGYTWGMWGAAIMYWEGKGTERNAAKAYGLAEAASQLGDIQAREIVGRLQPEMSGADLLHSERVTQEFLARGSAVRHSRLQWAAERLGLVVDPAAIPRDPASPDCTGRVPDVEVTATPTNWTARSFSYPIFARMDAQSADVYVAAHIGRSGKPCRVEAIDSTPGTREFKYEAVKGIESLTYEAPKINGQPVESLNMVKISFKITD